MRNEVAHQIKRKLDDNYVTVGTTNCKNSRAHNVLTKTFEVKLLESSEDLRLTRGKRIRL